MKNNKIINRLLRAKYFKVNKNDYKYDNDEILVIKYTPNFRHKKDSGNMFIQELSKIVENTEFNILGINDESIYFVRV
jgi:hypothetical protein